MNGHVDDKLRALIPVSVAASTSDELKEILAWIDTAFNGSLVVPRQDSRTGAGPGVIGRGSVGGWKHR